MWALGSFPWFKEANSNGSNECTNLGYWKCNEQCPHPRNSLLLWYNWNEWLISSLFPSEADEKKAQNHSKWLFLSSKVFRRKDFPLTKSLLQYGNFRSRRNCAVINNTQPFEITPPPSTMTNVNKYANTFSIFTDKSRHAWFAIEPLSILSGGSRNTSHPFVGSPTVRWLREKKRKLKEK